MSFMIGVDPHKGSHTAVAIGGGEAQLATVKVRATRHQLDQLLEWAAPFEERTWAIESAGGLGYLLAQQLVGAGERVLDVPATLAARVRVLGTGRSNKNDPNDAHSVAVAALRAPRLASVARADHAGVLRLLAKRNNELGRARNRTACRLHALLAELAPGGIANEINASSAERLLATEASRKFGPELLASCTLYSSAEPCAMCAAAAYWAGIGRVVYALSERRLKELIGAHPENPTLDLPCRTVFAAGQRRVEVVGPLLEDEGAALHEGVWRRSP